MNSLYKSLMGNRSVGVQGVSSELKCAEQYLLNKEMIGYDMSDIIAEQEYEENMYSKKICKLFSKK